MPGFDVSINVPTLFGFVLVLGIVVDDAIIVGENIYRHLEEHGDGMRGSIEGGVRDRETGDVRGPDDGGRVQSAIVRARGAGQGVPGVSSSVPGITPIDSTGYGDLR